MYTLIFFKVKNEEKIKKCCFLWIKKLFWPFWENNNKYLTHFNFKFSFWCLFFDVLYKEGFCEFPQKYLQIFKVLVNFFRMKTLPLVPRSRVRHSCMRCLRIKICPCFGIELLKNTSWAEMCCFSKIAKRTKSLHHTVQGYKIMYCIFLYR